MLVVLVVLVVVAMVVVVVVAEGRWSEFRIASQRSNPPHAGSLFHYLRVIRNNKHLFSHFDGAVKMIYNTI